MSSRRSKSKSALETGDAPPRRHDGRTRRWRNLDSLEDAKLYADLEEAETAWPSSRSLSETVLKHSPRVQGCGDETELSESSCTNGPSSIRWTSNVDLEAISSHDGWQPEVGEDIARLTSAESLQEAKTVCVSSRRASKTAPSQSKPVLEGDDAAALCESSPTAVLRSISEEAPEVADSANRYHRRRVRTLSAFVEESVEASPRCCSKEDGARQAAYSAEEANTVCPSSRSQSTGSSGHRSGSKTYHETAGWCDSSGSPAGDQRSSFRVPAHLDFQPTPPSTEPPETVRTSGRRPAFDVLARVTSRIAATKAVSGSRGASKEALVKPSGVSDISPRLELPIPSSPSVYRGLASEAMNMHSSRQNAAAESAPTSRRVSKEAVAKPTPMPPIPTEAQQDRQMLLCPPTPDQRLATIRELLAKRNDALCRPFTGSRHISKEAAEPGRSDFEEHPVPPRPEPPTLCVQPTSRQPSKGVTLPSPDAEPSSSSRGRSRKGTLDTSQAIPHNSFCPSLAKEFNCTPSFGCGRSTLEVLREDSPPVETVSRRSVSKETVAHRGVSKEHRGVSKEHRGVSKEHRGVSKEHRGVSKEVPPQRRASKKRVTNESAFSKWIRERGMMAAQPESEAEREYSRCDPTTDTFDNTQTIIPRAPSCEVDAAPKRKATKATTAIRKDEPLRPHELVAFARMSGLSLHEVQAEWTEFSKLPQLEGGGITLDTFEQQVRRKCNLTPYHHLPHHFRPCDHFGNVRFQDYLLWWSSVQFTEEVLVPDPRARMLREASRDLGLSLKDAEDIEYVFDKFDADRSGCLDEEEFVQVLKQLLHVRAEVSSPTFKHYWQHATSGRDDKVTICMFLRWYVANFFTTD
eukprot:TRINITY_DN39210_c0_g1_i2.p1 TRINITY_DN39210_c0_g1~~TRINITY_DN39210_c0_g1_i2.p1  ORF type:complete len:860 (-),score=122.92 TRINITY_DN39210_c0_g1_i2:517-3096(-)